MTATEARNLLDRFYNGSSTPADVEALRSFFAEADNIPDDLLADATIFADDSASSAPVPELDKFFDADFLDEIDAAVESENTIKLAPRRHKMIVWFSSAAAACLAAVMVYSLVSRPDTLSPDAMPPDNTTANASQSTPTADTIAVSEIKQTQAEMPMASVPAQAPKRNISNKIAKSKPVRHDNDGFVEITDPQVAAAILNNTAQVMSKTLNSADNSISRAKESISSGTKIISSALNNLKQ